MPLVKYVGNPTSADNTEVIHLKDADDGTPRSLTLNGDPVEVDGDELLRLAGHLQLEVLPDDYEDDGQDSAKRAGEALDKLAKEQGIHAGDSGDEPAFDATRAAAPVTPSPSPAPAPVAPAGVAGTPSTSPQVPPAAPGSDKE